mmetsp:Transcript_12565/g.15149  ORF Transcript_12565/g.15149 Transcript_12565/m.15149 type:complete len:142 (-) Transcript_12565:88-513(-)
MRPSGMRYSFAINSPKFSQVCFLQRTLFPAAAHAGSCFPNKNASMTSNARKFNSFSSPVSPSLFPSARDITKGAAFEDARSKRGRDRQQQQQDPEEQEQDPEQQEQEDPPPRRRNQDQEEEEVEQESAEEDADVNATESEI